MAFIDVAGAADITANASHAAQVDTLRLLLTRVDGQVYAVENRCPHLGLKMTRGKVEGAVIHCPWHGSTFDACTGANLDWIGAIAGMKVPQWSRGLIAFGKQPTAIRTFPTREENGRVFVDV